MFVSIISTKTKKIMWRGSSEVMYTCRKTFVNPKKKSGEISNVTEQFETKTVHRLTFTIFLNLTKKL